MAATSESSTDNDEPVLLGRIPHADLLTFLSLAQRSDSNLLEYSPRYNDDNRRTGGNAAVQMVYLSNESSSASRLPSFAFKRHELVRGLSHKARLKKIISELIIYECSAVRLNSHIGRLSGISWSVNSESPESLGAPLIFPVLGFVPSECGNLADHFEACHKVDLSLLRKLQLCCHIGDALRTLHSLNIAHGDLKPENVLVQNWKIPTAQLIDFDGSSFGLTDYDRVWVSGTKGWVDPELVRGNRNVTLKEAIRADVYSFGKICAWIIFQKILHIDDHVKDAGRTSPQRCETFDLGAAIEQARLIESDGSQIPFNHSELEIVKSMQSFLSVTFLGCAERRCGDIAEATMLLEGCLLSAKAATSQDQDEEAPKRLWVYRWLSKWYALWHVFHIILIYVVVTAVVAMMGFMLEETIRLGSNACSLQPNDRRTFMCGGGGVSFLILTPYLGMVITFLLGSTIRLSWLRALRWRRKGLHPDHMIELTEANILEIGHQAAQSVERPGFLTRLSKKLVIEDTDKYAPWEISARGHDLLFQFGNGGIGCHTLPDLVSLTPLLCRLHYRVRCQVVNDLRQRLSCSECFHQAKNMLYMCALLGIGEASRSDILPRTPAFLKQTLKRHLQADLGYWSSLPQLPFEVRNRIQEDRADLYTFKEIPTALRSTMTELLTKVGTGTQCRGTQILGSTMGRIFALLGRHEEAALCFYTSLTHRSKPRWRTFDDLALRMTDWVESPDGEMEGRRKRDQLVEAEHDLFLFSWVNELIIMNQNQEVIEEMRVIRDIEVAPNGLYCERETGHSFRQITHRVTDARNVLKGILLDNGMLEELEEMREEYDLADALGANGRSWYGQNPTSEQAFQCFLISERVASMLCQCGRFDDAIVMQRRLLSFCDKKLVHRDSADVQLLRQDLALSLSCSENSGYVEEASTIQTQLMADAHDEGKDPLLNLILNHIFTLAKTDCSSALIDEVQCQLEARHEWKTAVLRSQESRQPSLGTEFYWLHEIPGDLLTASLIQNALLATCVHLEGAARLRLVTLLCAIPSRSGLLRNHEEVNCFLKVEALQSNDSPLQQMMLWDRLICLLIHIGTTWEYPEKFDLAEQACDDMDNYVSIIPVDNEIEMRAISLRILVVCAKARYLNTTNTFTAANLDFWNTALNIRPTAWQKDSNNGKQMMYDISAKLSFASILKEKVIALGGPSHTEEVFSIFQDIDAERDSLLVVRMEHTHLASLLQMPAHRDHPFDDDPLRLALTECESTLGPTHPFTIRNRTRLAYSLDQRGCSAEACDLLKEVTGHTEIAFGIAHPQSLRARYNLLKLKGARADELGLHEYSYLPALSDLRYAALKVFGKEHPTTQEYLGAYALALERDVRAIVESIAIKRGVVRALGETLGVEHARTIQQTSERAGMLWRSGGDDHLEGRVLFECSLKLTTSLFGLSHARTQSLWKECVTVVVASSPGNQMAISPEPIALSTKAGKAPERREENDSEANTVDPQAREMLLSRLLLGKNHPITTGIQNRIPGPAQQYAYFDISNEEIVTTYWPIPPAKEIIEQWDEFLQPLRKIYERQRVGGLRARRNALGRSENRFRANGDARYVYIDHQGGMHDPGRRTSRQFF